MKTSKLKEMEAIEFIRVKDIDNYIKTLTPNNTEAKK